MSGLAQVPGVFMLDGRSAWPHNKFYGEFANIISDDLPLQERIVKQ